MPLRPIDAIFVQPERRCYVIYHNNDLWQLTRMKLDEASWWRRQPYRGDPEVLYLSQSQFIEDPELAAILRTLDLPKNLHGTSFPKFKDWWRTHGFDWLREIIVKGDSPLAGHNQQAKNPPSSQSSLTDNSLTSDLAGNSSSSPSTQANTSATDLATKPAAKTANGDLARSKPDTLSGKEKPAAKKRPSTGNVFDDMLAELTDEVLGSR